MKKFLAIVVLASLTPMSTGCSNPPVSVHAESVRLPSSEASIISIPYNPSMPKYVLVVEPFVSSNSRNIHSYTASEAGQISIGDKMAAQLTTALSRVGNFVLYDSRSAAKINLRNGEKGPYYVRATLTEFNETAVASENSSYVNASAEKKGTIAFDVQIIEKDTDRLEGSFEASGTFTAASPASGLTLFGIGNKKAQFASSALGQALRIAMNDAVLHTVQILR